MNKKLIIALAALAILAAALFVFRGAGLLHKPVEVKQGAAPLIVVSSAPIGLIGTVIAVGSGTVTIEGQPPGNTTPIRLKVAVDEKTSITKVGPAPTYATSTAAFTDLKAGMLLNIEAAAVSSEGAVRHAERVIIPPAVQ